MGQTAAMTDLSTSPVGDGRLGRLAVRLAVCFLAAMIVTTTMPGCSCRPDPAAKRKAEAEKRRKELEKKKPKKPPFEQTMLTAVPSDATQDKNRMPVKPGHWGVARQRLKANHDDFVGQMRLSAIDRKGQTLPLTRTAYQMTVSWPVSLPKGQPKHFDVPFLVPLSHKPSQELVQLQSRLVSQHAGRQVLGRAQTVEVLKSHQYFFVVLADRPADYGYLKRLGSVSPPWKDQDLGDPDTYYRVLLPDLTRRGAPLPANPLAWTSIAYVLWHDADPGAVNPAQQEAMIDWLHWGGQIVLTGSETLNLLQGSFLAPYLPAQPGKVEKLAAEAFGPMNDTWSIQQRKRNERRLLEFPADSPCEAVTLKPIPGAQFVPGTGELAVECRIGRGRVVATAFALTNRHLINWDNFDGFFNACVLRRLPRRFSSHNTMLHVAWADPQVLRNDARAVTSLRYFSRDRNAAAGPAAGGKRDAPENDARQWAQVRGFDPGYRSDNRSGVGGWNDFSGPASAARDSLRDAAGVSVPSARFVVQVLAVYLLALVPLNWGFFRAIGRVEWAWIAAPLIAIGGTGLVVKLAQLDIGFASGRSEIAVLEVQGGYDRGHLTRYVGLYTSLSTGYELLLDDDSALAAPFSLAGTNEQLARQGLSRVGFRRDKRTRLEGFRVMSNSTGMIHSEQMLALGGSIRLAGDPVTGFLLHNGTDFGFSGVGVIRRAGPRSVEVAWVGDLPPGGQTPLAFEPPADRKTLLASWNDSPVTAKDVPDGTLSLRGLLVLAQEPGGLATGDVRLVGWTERELPGLTVKPTPSQATCRSLIVAHLRRAPLSAPRPDANSRFDYND